MRYALWAVFALAVFIPATVVNLALWRFLSCEWDRPYGMEK